ncbi:prohibitin family protein [Hyphomicrobium sp. CS1BSMeth3]|uniref:prohibitin family protein n=1 Tax=Hyphomicrobium sp. CS1BSMeth3 TaxID=1892844 RepID=UPI0009303B48|nr:prohibitin family protein [Hyphomicrobium sp. CS1BSMeth3]
MRTSTPTTQGPGGSGRSGLPSLKLGSFGLAVIAALALITIWLGIYRIDAGHVGVVKRFGNVIDVADPGLHIKLPWADTVEEMEVRERAFNMTLEAASQDPLEIPIQVTVNWLVKREKVKELYIQFGSLDQFEKRIILPRLNDTVKGVTSAYTVNDLLRKRTEYRDRSMETFAKRMPDDVEITGFSVVNIGFPPEYTKAIRDKQVAREQAETEKFVLERQRLTSTQVTQSAEAQRDADKARADGRAYEIKVQGEAQAQAIRIMGEALAQNPLVVEYRKVEKWGGNFPTTFMGGDAGANTLWSMPGSGTPPATGGPPRAANAQPPRQ